MRGNMQYPAHYSFRCDADTAALIDAALPDGMPASAGMRELFEHPLMREALRRLAAGAVLAELRLGAHHGSAHARDPLDASQHQPQPDRAPPAPHPSFDAQEIDRVTRCDTLGTLRKDRPL